VPDIKLYRSDDSLLIRGIGERDIDLPNEDALRLADAIRAALVASPHKYSKWTPERLAKLRRLYEEGLSLAEIGTRLGAANAKTINSVRNKAGIPSRDPAKSARMRGKRHALRIA